MYRYVEKDFPLIYLVPTMEALPFGATEMQQTTAQTYGQLEH